MSPQPYHVTLTSTAPNVSIELLLGEEAPRLTGGFGGWDTIERPRDIAMTVWKGGEPYAFTLPVLLNAFPAGDVDADLQVLYSLARGSRNTPPPALTLDGVRAPAVQWVIDELDLDSPMLEVSTGRAVRQAVTIVLREYIAPEYSKVAKVPERLVVIRTKAKDTPATVAKKRRLKDWTEVRRLNPGVITKANQKLKVNTALRVPPLPKAKSKAKGKGKR